MQVTIDCGGINRPSKAKNDTNDCDSCTNSFNNVGVNTVEEITRAISKKIESDDLDPCSKEILTDLKTLGQNDIAKVIQRFGAPNSVYNWEIKTGTPTNPDNVFETDWERDNFNNAIPYEYSTLVNTSFVNQATDLAIARVILHEAIHAYILSFTDDVIATPTSTSLFDNFPEVWDFYVARKNGVEVGDLENAHHEQIASSFIGVIGDALAEYDNNQQSPQYYEDLAWGALLETKAFQESSNLTNEDKERITNNNNAEDLNSPNALGEPCN